MTGHFTSYENRTDTSYHTRRHVLPRKGKEADAGLGVPASINHQLLAWSLTCGDEQHHGKNGGRIGG